MLRKIICMRGLPGSGKTRLARKTLEYLPDGVIVSADDYFTLEDGSYLYLPSEIGAAHAMCFGKAISHCQGTMNTDGVMFVDNTNISAIEIAPYAQLAAAHAISFEIWHVHASIEDCIRRNVHGVPAKVLFTMQRRLLVEELPPWWQVRYLMPDDAPPALVATKEFATPAF